MFVLGIESTCDETAASVVESGKIIHSHCISSQVDLQKIYGGVFPEIACRRHVDVINQVLEEALDGLQTPDLIAVAKGPGLIGAIHVGLNAAKALSVAWSVPFVGVSHIEAHLYACFMGESTPELPALGVIVSGGHSSLVLVHDVGEYSLISQTVDDAVGEAFDKVARMLDLPYPGGPEIEKWALLGDPHRFNLRAGRVKGQPLAFSFSGLKTKVLYSLQDVTVDDTIRADMAASFQEVALRDIVDKAKCAAAQFDAKSILVGGGVSQSQKLYSLFDACELPVYFPPKGLSLDNAAMIAGLGYHQYKKLGADNLDLKAETRIPLSAVKSSHVGPQKG